MFTNNEQISIEPLISSIKDNFTYECWVRPLKSHIVDQMNGLAQKNGKSFLVSPTCSKDPRFSGIGFSVATNGITVYEHSSNHYFLPVLVYKQKLLDWTHIALVYKEKKTVLYVNGRKVREGTITRKTSVIPSGTFGGGEEGSHFKGEVRSLKVWGKSLTKEQINININRTTFAGESDLYWGCDYYNHSTYRKGVKQAVKVSVIMPNYNKHPQNLLALKSFEQQIFNKEEFEVLLVDDASTDGSITIIEQEKFSFPFKYIRCHSNIGRPRARNLGIQHACGEVIVFLDAEILVKPDFIYQHYFAHSNHDHLAVSGSMTLRGVYSIYYPNFSNKQKQHFHTMLKQYRRAIQKLCENEPQKTIQLLSQQDIINQHFINWSFEKEHSNHFKKTLFDHFGNDMKGFHFPWFIFCTGNVSVKLQTLKKVGLFEEYPGYGWDDIEMGYRLHKAGIKIINHPGLTTFHQEHPIAVTNSTDANQNFYFYFEKTFPNQYNDIKHAFYFMLDRVAFKKARGLQLKNLLQGSSYKVETIKSQLRELKKIPKVNTFASNFLNMIEN
jgi:glycosyltransferase involved in cell wall biosynthesis